MLLQVYLHAAIAAQAGEFDIEDVARGLVEKMLRRNPHVFGDSHETDPARINETWETLRPRRSSAPACSTAFRPSSPHSAVPPRSSTGSSAQAVRCPARPGETAATSATGCSPSWPRLASPVSTRSRPCATPYAESARDPSGRIGPRGAAGHAHERVRARRGRRDGAEAHAHRHEVPGPRGAGERADRRGRRVARPRWCGRRRARCTSAPSRVESRRCGSTRSSSSPAGCYFVSRSELWFTDLSRVRATGLMGVHPGVDDSVTPTPCGSRSRRTRAPTRCTPTTSAPVSRSGRPRPCLPRMRTCAARQSGLQYSAPGGREAVEARQRSRRLRPRRRRRRTAGRRTTQ